MKGAPAGTRRLIAIVTDIYGNPIADSPVSLSVKSGVVKPVRAVTDAKGRVGVTWTLSSAAGEQTLTGRVRGADVSGQYITTLKTASKPRK